MNPRMKSIAVSGSLNRWDRWYIITLLAVYYPLIWYNLHIMPIWVIIIDHLPPIKGTRNSYQLLMKLHWGETSSWWVDVLRGRNLTGTTSRLGRGWQGRDDKWGMEGLGWVKFKTLEVERVREDEKVVFFGVIFFGLVGNWEKLIGVHNGYSQVVVYSGWWRVASKVGLQDTLIVRSINRTMVSHTSSQQAATMNTVPSWQLTYPRWLSFSQMGYVSSLGRYP